MKRNQFHSFLVTDYRGPNTGRPLGGSSSVSYCVKAARVEAHLGAALDQADLSEAGIAHILARLRATGRVSEQALYQCVSVLKAYAQFRNWTPRGAPGPVRVTASAEA